MSPGDNQPFAQAQCSRDREIDNTGGRLLAKQTFDADVESLPPMRDFVEKWAAEVGLGEQQTYRIKLAVAEACANAINHPETMADITLWAWNRGDRFTVDVWYPGELHIKTLENRGYRGMGLPLMVVSADEVSFACVPGGGTRVSLSVILE